jgi:uncharacterized damage-inducible protein DinB
MGIAEALIPEFDEELAATRRVLERVPEHSSDWKPHPKSMPFDRLATLVAEMPGWFVNVLTEPVLEIPVPFTPLVLGSRQEMLDLFDEHVAAARETLLKTADGEFDRTWTLRFGGEDVFTLPKNVVYRRMVMNHLVHHRAQLMVYLRMNEIPVPGVYGASADEH